MLQVKVYYEDTDAGGIVYHTNFIKFCERARSEVFFRAQEEHEVDCEFIVRKMNIDFFSPARLGDILEVDTKVLEVKRASIKLHHDICKGDKIIFSMDVLLVSVSSSVTNREIQERRKRGEMDEKIKIVSCPNVVVQLFQEAQSHPN